MDSAQAAWVSTELPTGLTALTAAGLSAGLITTYSQKACRFVGRARGVVLRGEVIADLSKESIRNRRRAVKALLQLSSEDFIEFVENVHSSSCLPSKGTARYGVYVYFQDSTDPTFQGDIVVNHVVIRGDDGDPDDEPLAHSTELSALARHKEFQQIRRKPESSRIRPTKNFGASDIRDYIVRFELSKLLSFLFVAMFNPVGRGSELLFSSHEYDFDIVACKFTARDFRHFAVFGSQIQNLHLRKEKRRIGRIWSNLASRALLRRSILKEIRRKLEQNDNSLCLDVLISLDSSSRLTVKIGAQFLTKGDHVSWDLLLTSDIQCAKVPSLRYGPGDSRRETGSKAQARLIVLLRPISN